MLMERFHITGLQAFQLLASLSQEQNVKLVDLSRRLVDLHEGGADSNPGSVSEVR